MTTLPLACTVRTCGFPLARQQRSFVCSRGHAYDVARSGYVNLLQPQDRRSLAAGDSKAAVQARAELLRAGVGRALVDAVAARAASLLGEPGLVAIDLGSGTGDTLAALARLRPITGIGIDLSTAAADHAARQFPGQAWVVANADRRLPILDGAVALVLSLHGRRNPAECARVLAADGALVVALPGPDDLLELRALVHGAAVERSRDAALIAAHTPFFSVADRVSVRDRLRLTPESLRALLRATYRGARASVAARVDTLGTLDVTLASEVLVFARR